MKLNTVNVIEYFSDSVQAVHSFTDDAEGNKEAELLFKQIAKDNSFSESAIEFGLEEGYLEHSLDYQVYIVHS